MDINKWIKQACTLGYFDRRVLLAKKVNPPQSRFIYKFRSIDPHSNTSIERTRDILVNNQVWLSSPGDFNDPFDMQAKIIINGTGKEIRDRYKKIQKRMGIKHKEREKQLTQLMRKSPKEREIEFNGYYKNHINSMGVCSFAGDPRSILMWSHYAKDHEGICIQFERARDYRVLCKAINVDYEEEYPTIDWLNNYQNDLSKALLRKHEKWSYENEQRIIERQKANSILCVKPQSITGVIFGCSCNKKTKDTVFSLLKERKSKGYPEVRLFSAQLHSSRYKLVLCDENIS